MSAKSLALSLLMGLTACGANSEPSCKSGTATEALRQGVEQDLLAMQVYGQSVKVTKVEGAPVEQRQFGVLCQAVVEIAGVDLSKSKGRENEKNNLVSPFRIKIAYRVDKVDGELVTRWDAIDLFRVVGLAASFKAAEDSGVSITDHIFGTQGK